ncbi:MAG: hypothetical protein IJP75_05650 [Bacteroidaceae bacterium]|nr:hypothetical protein [Bacteroidaceae bacterium]
MNTTISLENILHMLRGLSLSNRQWLAEHLVEPAEMEQAAQRKSDAQLVRDLQALRYEGEPTTEEKKQMLRDSHFFGGRRIKYKYDEE